MTEDQLEKLILVSDRAVPSVGFHPHILYWITYSYNHEDYKRKNEQLELQVDTIYCAD